MDGGEAADVFVAAAVDDDDADVDDGATGDVDEASGDDDEGASLRIADKRRRRMGLGSG